MLKWTVNSKRGEGQAPPRVSPDGTARQRRRSLGGPPCRRKIKHHYRPRRSMQDKENRNSIGCTPCFPKEALNIRNTVLQDVSNITPKSLTPATPKSLGSTPHRRRTRSNRKSRSGSKENILINKSTPKATAQVPSVKKRRILLDSDIYVDENVNIEEVTSQPLENNKRVCIEKKQAPKSAIKSKIHAPSLPTFEIEYSPCENNSVHNNSTITTLPIIGTGIFIKNPLYFNQAELQKTKTELVENFGALLQKMSPMSALRQNGCKERTKICSEVSPLARKLASFCFNKLNGANNINEENKTKNPFDVKRRRPLVISKDDEASVEMETKMIGDKSLSDDSSITDSKMGDETLEKMIDDIIKSTKRVKHARRIKLNTSVKSEQEEVIKKVSPMVKFREQLESEKTYILYDPDNCNEREVRTPENKLSTSLDTGVETLLKKCSMSSTNKKTSRKRSNSADCTPNNSSCLNDEDFNLKRQRCVRRKRHCTRDEGFEDATSSLKESCLTLKTGIPSPFSPAEINKCRLLDSSPYSSITGYPFVKESTDFPSPTLNNIHFNVEKSTSSQLSPEKDTSHFGLTLQCGIPSPLSPYTSNAMSDEGINSGLFSCSNTSSIPKDDDIDIISEPVTPIVEFKTSRRCLTYSPEDADSSKVSGKLRSGQSRNGTIDLTIQCVDNKINVHILGCRNLQKTNGDNETINAYVKVSMSGSHGYQRTPVRRNSSSPHFDHTIQLRVPDLMHSRHRLNISIWHRDSQNRRSEFLGWCWFWGRNVCKSGNKISGTYWLLLRRNPNTMTTTAEDPPLDNDSGVNARLASQQREADEHLFLRYLELDPVEGPDAPAAAVQRTKAGIKQGRTPFTTTRRLDRGNDQGFGFSVLWTRPPRVERVDAGRAADRAGLHPGDYIVFVDRHNVVTMPESQVLTLIKSSGPQLLLETFRRGTGESKTLPTRGRGSLTSHTLSDAPCSPAVLKTNSLNRMTTSSIAADQTLTESVEWRASTACSNNTAATSAPSRRRPLLPQVAFTTESMTGLGSIASVVAGGSGNNNDHVKALQAVVAREQHFAHCLQFGMERYVIPLASRTDIISANEHKLLFQNCEELLRLSEDILEQLMNEDGEIQVHHIVNVYLSKLPTIISLYKSYCNGLKRADCVLVQKLKQQGGGFAKACTEPPVGRRKPDITQLIHKPLEQFREILRLLRTARAAVNPSHSNYKSLHSLVSHLQTAYHEVTASAGLMGPVGEGRPLLSVADLESRLVFTRCKPFVLAKPGRQWIFGGDLCRVEGRTVRPFWALLFTDLLLFATVSRDRVLFITEDPLPISNISETCFNIRKKANEFRLGIGSGRAGSPTARCGPPSRLRMRSMHLRAPSPDLKAVWQSLLLRQIYRVNSSTGTPLSSPMESPAPLCYSEVTLDSQNRQVTHSSSLGHRSRSSQACSQRNLHSEGRYHHSTNNAEPDNTAAENRSIRSSCKGTSLHLTQWLKTHPGSGPIEPEPEIWSIEQFRKRSQELKLLDVVEQATCKSTLTAGTVNGTHLEKSPSENEHSPSRSTNSDSQITVRSSPVVPETVAVCRQCHKRCFSKPGSPHITTKTPSPCDKTKSPNNNTPSQTTMICQQQTQVSKAQTQNGNVLSNGCHQLQKQQSEIRQLVNTIAETRISNSPENNFKFECKETFQNSSPSIRNRLSREEFFRSSISKDNSNSNCSERISKSPSSRSPSNRSDSSRSTLFSANSPLSFAHTTCSSIPMSYTSAGMKSQSPGRDSNASISDKEDGVQCVIAQEKYLNEVKCVENITLTKNASSRIQMGKAADRYAMATKFVSHCMNTDKNKGTDEEFFRSAVKTAANGDIRRHENHVEDNNNEQQQGRTGIDFSWGPLMLMGLSTMNPAAQILALDQEEKTTPPKPAPRRIGVPITNPNMRQQQVPNISVVPPTPDFKTDPHILSAQSTLEESPDESPLAEEPPYLALKRYGTMSSLERLPSDELDDAIGLENERAEKTNEGAQGLLGWTARAGNYVVEKMALFNSLAESGAASTGASFFERYLGAGEWKTVRSTVEVDGGEGSGASGEECWGTPSSGDLSDQAFPDSDHATLSSPTKSSSSCPGDEDTELMMDELLMTPPMVGPSLRPLLPRRRLEPLLEEEGSDSSSTTSAAGSEVTSSSTQEQGRGAEQGAAAARDRGGVADDAPPAAPSPDRTPTNALPPQSPQQLSDLLLGGQEDKSSSSSTPKSADVGGAMPDLGGGMAGTGADGDISDVVGDGKEEGTLLHLSPRMEMSLVLQEGTDLLAEQEHLWDQLNGPYGWVRRPIGMLQHPRLQMSPRRTSITSNNSVSAQQEAVKVTAMERLAMLEARGARRGGRRPRPTARIMGLVRRRASSDSPERRPYSPRRQHPHVSNHAYYKICFVNGFV